jgi:hypothetical protein
MSHLNQRKRVREREREFQQKRRESRLLSTNAVLIKTDPTGLEAEAKKWPVIQAFVPVRDVFQATGFGTAGVIRLRPDGKWITSYFSISLADQGITMMYGKDSTNERENREFLESLTDGMPPMEPGPVELTSRYVWGAFALGESEGYSFADTRSKRYLDMVPPLSGKRAWWLQQFKGPHGLAAPELVRFVNENRPPVDVEIPDDKEVIVFTAARFAISDPAAVTRQLKARSPEFTLDSEPGEPTHNFNWSREYPKNHWSPLRLLGGRQNLGSVEVGPDYLIANSKTLSMTAVLLAKLKRQFGDAIHLTGTTWKSTDDLIREAKENPDILE